MFLKVYYTRKIQKVYNYIDKISTVNLVNIYIWCLLCMPATVLSSFHILTATLSGEYCFYYNNNTHKETKAQS